MLLIGAVLRQFWVTAESTRGGVFMPTICVHSAHKANMPHDETRSTISSDELTHSMDSSRTRICADGQRFHAQKGNFPYTHILRTM